MDMMEDIQCIFCKKPSDVVAIEENGYTGKKCPICNLIYISPRPRYVQTIERYAKDASNTSAYSIISDDFPKRLNAKHTLSIIKQYANKGTILEIGAGAGYFLDEARKNGFEVYGIEINRIQSEFINNVLKIPCENTKLSESSFSNKRFDIIYHCNVLSHLSDPLEEFRIINQKLESGGMHVFETGNVGDVNRKYYRFLGTFDYPDHLFFFSVRSIERLLEEAKYNCLKIYKYSILPRLLVDKVLAGIRSNSRSQETIKAVKLDPTVNNSISVRRNNKKQILKYMRIYLSYILTYKIGKIFPGKNIPQTLIIVARKQS